MDRQHALKPGKGLLEISAAPCVAAFRPIAAIKDAVIVLKSGERLNYVDVYRNRANTNIIRSAQPFVANQQYFLSIFNRDNKSWDAFIGTLEGLAHDPEQSDYHYSRLRLVALKDKPHNVDPDDEHHQGL